MDETATRRTKIDPKLYNVGWESVPDSVILTEQRAYEIAPGRVERIKHSKPKKADYVLEYRGQKLAVIEAKSDERHVSEGVEQAKLYAEMLNIRFTYATNGEERQGRICHPKQGRTSGEIPKSAGTLENDIPRHKRVEGQI